MPEMKAAWEIVLDVPQKVRKVPQRVLAAPMRIVGYKRNRDWTLNAMAIARSRWPNVWGRLYVRKTLKGLCKGPEPSYELLN